MDKNKGYGLVIPTDWKVGKWNKLTAQEIVSQLKELNRDAFYRMAAAADIDLALLEQSGYVYDGLSEVAKKELEAFVPKRKFSEVRKLLSEADFQKHHDFQFVFHLYNDRNSTVAELYTPEIAAEILKSRGYSLMDERENVRNLMALFIGEFEDDKTDAIKPDKAFYIFNTPIESKQTYKDDEGHERKERGYDFDGFQKHLLFIYEFSKQFPNSGQLVTQLEAFSKRVEEQLSTKTISYEEVSINLETGETIKENKTKERKGHLWENISAMVAISVEIAANNLRAANNALKIASQLLSDMRPEDQQKKKEIIGLIYKKLYRIPNSAFLQVWLQNITHTTDDWSAGDIYDMPLCKVVAEQPVTLWNNSWLIPKIASTFPQESIVDRESLAKTGQVITFKAKRQYDEMEY